MTKLRKDVEFTMPLPHISYEMGRTKVSHLGEIRVLARVKFEEGGNIKDIEYREIFWNDQDITYLVQHSHFLAEMRVFIEAATTAQSIYSQPIHLA